MTIQEYNIIEKNVKNTTTISEATFKWELLKVLWEIRDALKIGLED